MLHPADYFELIWSCYRDARHFKSNCFIELFSGQKNSHKLIAGALSAKGCCKGWRSYRSIQSDQTKSQKTDVVFVHYREKFPHVFHQKSDISILLHLSTASGSQESNSMLFQRKGISDLWIAVQNIWNFRKISQVLCTVIL